MSYTLLKHLHVTCVVISATLFFVRGLLMLWRPQMLRARWARTLPHTNDAVLLLAAIGMLVTAQMNPLAQPWLATKLAALLLYIGLGMVAMRFGRSRGVRLAAWLAALAVLSWMIAMARTKQVVPF
jgi:uncharacterized membrane protein SirB2